MLGIVPVLYSFKRPRLRGCLLLLSQAQFPAGNQDSPSEDPTTL